VACRKHNCKKSKERIVSCLRETGKSPKIISKREYTRDSCGISGERREGESHKEERVKSGGNLILSTRPACILRNRKGITNEKRGGPKRGCVRRGVK